MIDYIRKRLAHLRINKPEGWEHRHKELMILLRKFER